MFINDLLDDNILPVLVITFIIFIVIMIFAIPAGIAKSKQANQSIYGSDSPVKPPQEVTAKIIARRTAPHPLNPAVMVNTILFEMPNGTRIELAIKDNSVFGTMVEGDKGLLRYSENSFISFRRNVG